MIQRSIYRAAVRGGDGVGGVIILRTTKGSLSQSNVSGSKKKKKKKVLPIHFKGELRISAISLYRPHMQHLLSVCQFNLLSQHH